MLCISQLCKSVLIAKYSPVCAVDDAGDQSTADDTGDQSTADDAGNQSIVDDAGNQSAVDDAGDQSLLLPTNMKSNSQRNVSS